MGTPPPLWTVEEACRNAYPAREILLDGWMLRAAGGRSRRTNSVNPLNADDRGGGMIISRAEAVYASLGRPTIFRIPEIASGLDAALERRGYRRDGDTATLWTALPLGKPDTIADVALAPKPVAAWLQAWGALNADATAGDAAAFVGSIEAILLPAAFATRHCDGRAAALAYAVLDRGLVVLEAVVTDASLRGRGHAGAVVRSLLAWAAAHGATGACLQVAVDNAPALALYRALGFGRLLYRYHYRVAPLR